MEWMIGLLSFVVIALIAALNKEAKLKNEYLTQYKKWEAEYWLVRTYASNYYNIHLSWLPRGEDDCIKPKETE